MPVPQGREGVHEVMHRFKHRTLHSGSHTGPIVRDRRQAIAIALNAAGMSRKGKRKGKRGRRKQRR